MTFKRLLEKDISASFGAELFSRTLALVFFFAFFSLAVQIKPLLGENGIMPARELLESAKPYFGSAYFLKLPTLGWISTTGNFLLGICFAGMLASLLNTLGFAARTAAALQWFFYLSLVNVGNVFLQYQWEGLLLEAGLLSIFLAPNQWRTKLGSAPPPRVWAVWLVKFLLFKLMLSSGLAKLFSGDLAWRSLNALSFHFETQPLPTSLAWFAHHLPGLVQKGLCLFMFGVELFVPFLFFLNSRFRLIAFILQTAFQVGLIATGNYTFFNYLCLALALILVDQKYFARLKFLKLVPASHFARQRTPMILIFLFLTLADVSQILTLRGGSLPGMSQLLEKVPYYFLSNNYGLFAVMTTERNEIEIEGSGDGEVWQAIPFRYKPEALNCAPPFVAPYQPRLDWQAWFAALGDFPQQGWLASLLAKILNGDPEPAALMGENPFSTTPPKFVRVQLYRYRFSPWSDLKKGNWWTREFVGPYSPVFSRK